MHFLELPRLREAIATGETEHPLVQWMLFIDCESQEVIEMLAHDNKDIRQAYTLLQVISQDKLKRMAYEARQAEIMDQRSRMISAEMKGREEGKVEGREEGRKEGRKEGRQEGRQEVVRSMLTRGMSIDEVAEIAGMSREQIAALQGEIQVE
ncbi:hypothetical protein JCM31598_17130 [Desulfonatronum parangueonense]